MLAYVFGTDLSLMPIASFMKRHWFASRPICFAANRPDSSPPDRSASSPSPG